MSRIARKFRELRSSKQKALILFITAGDPSLASTVDLVLEFEKRGVDVVELGVPFSDPLADGPVIQAASQRSLAGGTTLSKILGAVRQMRRRGATVPLVLMTYLNPILRYGLKEFCRDAVAAGVDGVIFPELPAGEEKEFSDQIRRSGLDLIYLAAPTSPASRKKMVAKASKGFIYYVSLTGVTGGGGSAAQSVAQNVRQIRQYSKLPVCVGFGVSTPEQARQMSSVSDGVIVGSAIVKALEAHPRLSAKAFCDRHVGGFLRAVKG